VVLGILLLWHSCELIRWYLYLPVFYCYWLISILTMFGKQWVSCDTVNDMNCVLSVAHIS